MTRLAPRLSAVLMLAAAVWAVIVMAAVCVEAFVADAPEVHVEAPAVEAPAPSPCRRGENACCDPNGSGALLIPGTGIIPSHDACPQPPLQHAPEGTGPNTGPRGEQQP